MKYVTIKGVRFMLDVDSDGRPVLHLYDGLEDGKRLMAYEDFAGRYCNRRLPDSLSVDTVEDLLTKAEVPFEKGELQQYGAAWITVLEADEDAAVAAVWGGADEGS